jgi:protein SCO1/2
MTARPLLIGVLAIVAFALGLGLARGCLGPVPVAPERATAFAEPRALPPIQLIDQNGRVFDDDSLRRGWTLVFFGFTRCPDVCPTTLATLARARSALADLPPEAQPRVLLISVDPEYDTAERLAAYVRSFDPDFLGATGDPAAIAAVAAGFGVPHARVAAGTDGYTIDHGSGVFVVAPEGIVAYSGAPHDAEVLARDFRRIVARHGTRR